MTRFDQRYETPKWRTLWLLTAFALLVGIGIVTVLLPELEDEPTEEAGAGAEPQVEADVDGGVQE